MVDEAAIGDGVMFVDRVTLTGASNGLEIKVPDPAISCFTAVTVDGVVVLIAVPRVEAIGLAVSIVCVD